MKIAIDIKSGAVKKDTTEDKKIIVGIDLGTTNSLIAYVEGDQPKTITDFESNNTIVPSIIYFDENDQPIVGHSAKDHLVSDPSRTIYSIKRLMGKSYTDVGDDHIGTGYKILESKDEESLVKIVINEKYYSPIELSAIILMQLKENAEKHLRQEISQAVITVPAYFNDSQRQATRDAGKLAGLDVLRIVNEPTAASLAYGIGIDRETESTVAVYDLGGGTFDISILKIEDGIFEVLSTHGDTHLGGDDFDNAIVDFWVEELGLHKNDLFKDKSKSQLFRLAAEEAKKSLSNNTEFNKQIDGHTFKLDLSTFNRLISPLIDKTIQSCKQAIKDAKISVAEIDKVIMVGGSTRVPLVNKMVAKIFNQKPYDELNPDEVVAKGAAIQADILAGNRKDLLLLDVTPLSLGIETVGGLMDTIIPRNNKVPSKAGRQYTTSIDGQKNLKVAVYQGERELVQDNRKLGEFILRDIPPMAAGMPKIDIKFILDADGILTVKASEVRSGTETTVEIKSTYGISEEEMATMLLESIKNAEADMKIRSLTEAKNEANNIILSSKKFIEQNKSILSKEEIDNINDLIKNLTTTSSGDDKDKIQSMMDKINHYTTPIAQRALDYNIQQSLKGKEI